MRIRSVLVGLALCGLIDVPAVHAQEAADDAARTRFELTPFVGYRFGGGFDIQETPQDADADDGVSFAAAVGLRTDELSQYELFYSRQSTSLESNSAFVDADLDIEYLQLGGTVPVENVRFLNPYIVGSLGVTRLSLGVAGVSDETRFSLSVGGGLRIPVRPRIDVRLEARVYLTFLDKDSAVFCASGMSGGVCALRSSGSQFVQYGLLAGAAYAF